VCLETIERQSEVTIHLERLLFLDHACLQVLGDFHRLYERQGGNVTTEWTELKRLSKDQKLRVAIS
jgi:anti-anti-sigma regulatory factor